MLFVWRGHGWVVLAMPVAMLFVLWAALQVPALAAWLGPPRGGAIALTFVFGLAGLVVTLWGLATNTRRASWVIHPMTGHECRMGARHSLYGVPVQYWGMAGLAVAWVNAPTLPLP